MGYYDEKEREVLRRAERIVFEQIDQITANNDINNQELELMDKLIDIIKDIKETCAMDDSIAGGYSGNSYAYGNGGRGYSQRMPHMGWGYPYDGMSFDQNTNYNQSMNSNRSGMQNRYSRDDYKHRLVSELQRAMDEAANEKERNAIMQCMNALEW